MTAARAAAAVVLLGAACSRRPDVPILTYHSVSAATDGFTVGAEAFTGMLDRLRNSGFHTVTFQEWLEHSDHGAPLPLHPVILTFDDGYADAYETVLPALRARGMRAAFFVVTSFVGADESHRVVRDEGGVRRRYLIWPEVRALAAAGMEIGSHSVSHRRFTDLTEADARNELADSKRQLESALGKPVEIFAYPYNSVRRWMRPLVREAGYRAAVAGIEHGNADRFSLYRIGVYRGTTAETLLAQLTASGAAQAR